MFNPFRSFIRTSAFVRKEVVEIFRQPQLLLTLVLGPFVILLLFGIGYRSEGRTLRTLFVVDPQDPIANQIKTYAPKMGSQLRFTGIDTDLNRAKQKLRKGEVDLVVVAPPDAFDTIRNNKQAIFRLYHDEIDPYQADYIRFTGELYTDKLNRWLLTSTAQSKRGEVYNVQSDLKELIQKTHEFRSAVDGGQAQVARQRRSEIIAKLNSIEASIGSQVEAVQTGTAKSKVQMALGDLRRIKQQLQTNSEPSAEDSQHAAGIERDMAQIESHIGEISRLDPEVLFSPFRSITQGIAPEQPKLQEYFAPSVIVLLLQHLAITLAALSIVREFRTGSVELFKISPLLKGELLLGKYIGYLLVGSFVAAVLSVLLVFGLKIPMLGNWYYYAAVLLSLLVASLGVGFLVSLISETDSQAIQYSMILLLLSIFFTGFLLNLHLLWKPVRGISWLLPATYGIRLMQDIMLRGVAPNPILIGVLGAAGVCLFVLCALMLSRKLASR